MTLLFGDTNNGPVHLNNLVLLFFKAFIWKCRIANTRPNAVGTKQRTTKQRNYKTAKKMENNKTATIT